MINRLITEHGISKQDILGVFYSSSSHTKEGIGMELERIPIDDNQNTAVYSNGENGVKEILEEISQKLYWQKIYDDNVLIGLKQSNATITLEPGCQVEISVDPQKHITDLKYEIEKIDKEIKPIFNKYGIKLLEYGISPKSTVKDIKIFPKKRYKYMANYLSGILAPSMMKETAGIQVSVDYKNEEDAIKKLRIFTKISPVMTAIFANSPCKNGKFTGYKSTRALAWLNTDNNRCGLISEKLFDKNYDFSFSDYVDTILNIPMLYFSRTENKNNSTSPFRKDILINGKINFKEFMENGYEGYEAELNDYALHQSLFFPEVRLKKYLEIRNHDCQNGDMKYAIPTIYKGLAYNEKALSDLINLFDEFSYKDICEARFSVPKYALNAKMGNKKIGDLAKEVLKIAETSLNDDIDLKFLQPLNSMLEKNQCPADFIINKM